MIMLVAVSFFLSWTPFYAVTTVTQLQTDSFLRRSQFLFTMLATHWTGFCSSAANPLIYAAMSYQFRHSFKQVRHEEEGTKIASDSILVILTGWPKSKPLSKVIIQKTVTEAKLSCF